MAIVFGIFFYLFRALRLSRAVSGLWACVRPSGCVLLRARGLTIRFQAEPSSDRQEDLLAFRMTPSCNMYADDYNDIECGKGNIHVVSIELGACRHDDIECGKGNIHGVSVELGVCRHGEHDKKPLAHSLKTQLH